MRIGIFSDVHANAEALTAVFEAFRSERTDKLVCLGDTVGYGASPNECCDLIRDAAAFTILGNHDAAVAGRMDYSYYYDAARNALDLHSRELSPENMAWLKTLPYEVREEHATFCHGSPLNLEEFEYIFSVEQAARCLEIWDALGTVTVDVQATGDGCFRVSPLPAEIGGGAGVTYPVTISVKSEDGRLDGTYAGSVVASGTGSERTVTATAYLDLSVDDVAKSGFSDVTVPAGSDGLRVNIELTLEGGVVSGIVRLVSVTNPPCLTNPEPPMSTPGGGMSTPGCSGQAQTQLEVASW